MTDADLAEALDVLDWSTDDEIRSLRQHVATTIARAQERRTAGAVRRTTTEWSAVQIAMFLILWQTMDDTLEAWVARST